MYISAIQIFSRMVKSIFQRDGNSLILLRTWRNSKSGMFCCNRNWNCCIIILLCSTYQFKKNERIITFFQNFDDFIGEDAMWQLSESIKPRGGKKTTQWKLYTALNNVRAIYLIYFSAIIFFVLNVVMLMDYSGFYIRSYCKR